MASPNFRQRLFATEYLIDFNATRAAIRAGYSEKTAYSQGARLLKHDVVAGLIDEAIDKALGTQREQIKYRVLKELQAIAFADISDDVKIVTRTVERHVVNSDGGITDDVFDEEIQLVDLVDTVDSKNRRAIASIRQNEKGMIEIKYHDKLRALEMLGKYGTLFKEQLEIVLPDMGGLHVYHHAIVREDVAAMETVEIGGSIVALPEPDGGNGSDGSNGSSGKAEEA